MAESVRERPHEDPWLPECEHGPPSCVHHRGWRGQDQPDQPSALESIAARRRSICGQRKAEGDRGSSRHRDPTSSRAAGEAASAAIELEAVSAGPPRRATQEEVQHADQARDRRSSSEEAWWRLARPCALHRVEHFSDSHRNSLVSRRYLLRRCPLISNEAMRQ